MLEHSGCQQCKPCLDRILILEEALERIKVYTEGSTIELVAKQALRSYEHNPWDEKNFPRMDLTK